MASDNKLLGQFNLEGIPPSPRGMPQIEVSFDIDANGIVSVSAKDKASGKEQRITIQASGGLSEDDINKMVKDAEANAGEDKKRREQIEAKNHADSLIYSAEKSLKEYSDKISSDVKAKIEADIESLKQSLSTENVEDIKAKTEALMQSSMSIGEMMYKDQQPHSAEQHSASDHSGNPEDSAKVVDAEFEEVKEDEDKK